MDAASQLAADHIAVNCFRIDLAVASEGFVANTPGADHSNWEPSEVAAEGIVWMVRQPVAYSGHRESMFALRHREGIMASQVPHPATEAASRGVARRPGGGHRNRVRRAVSRRPGAGHLTRK